jgi:alginate O-acetyltransferase complex protein AlgI
MLFNSYVFLLAFLPITLVGFYALSSAGSLRAARVWLLASSFFFFAWWSVVYCFMLVALIALNFALGNAIRQRPHAAKLLCITGVTVNLGVLAYYKYSAFIVENVQALTGVEFGIHAVVLPLAISFYTFQQIAYLVDVMKGNAPKYSFLEYAWFVTFFPQLIAGPIVRHDEVIPQLRAPEFGRFDHGVFASGIAFLVIGLFKKVVIADPVSELAGPVFDGTATPALADAWIGVSAYTIGLYFDFSGYCDMAVGLGRMFGVRLPYNFDSPYKADSIIDFWRRWHITLSRFLREYLYIALGGNRRGEPRRYVNLMLTMLLGGLWHGAAWTFVVWGGLHGLYLVINHFWNKLVQRAQAAGHHLALGRTQARALTLFAVMIAWVFFRAPDFSRAIEVLQGMFGAAGLVSVATVATFDSVIVQHGFRPDVGLLDWWVHIHPFLLLAGGFALVLFAPNSQEIVDGIRATAPRRHAQLIFRPNFVTAATAAAVFFTSLVLMSDVKEFVYFQF